MRTLFTAFLFIATLAQPAVALQGNKNFRRFSTAEYIALPLLAGANVAAWNIGPPEQPLWKGGILVDDASRSALRFGSKSSRDSITTVGDIMLYSLIAYPLLVDAALNVGLSEKEGRIAANLAFIGMQSFLLTSAVTVFTKGLVGRERPYQTECAKDPGYDNGCNGNDSRRSFFSGHSSLAFTGAGLVCAGHEVLDLWGGKTPCYIALGGAALTSITRVMADKHYLSDTLVGALVGGLSGYLLPKLLHYDEQQTAMVAPYSTEKNLGLMISVPL